MAVQVHPMKPVLKAPGTKRLRPQYKKLLSTVGFNFNLRCYIVDGVAVLLGRQGGATCRVDENLQQISVVYNTRVAPVTKRAVHQSSNLTSRTPIC